MKEKDYSVGSLVKFTNHWIADHWGNIDNNKFENLAFCTGIVVNRKNGLYANSNEKINDRDRCYFLLQIFFGGKIIKIPSYAVELI